MLRKKDKYGPNLISRNKLTNIAYHHRTVLIVYPIHRCASFANINGEQIGRILPHLLRTHEEMLTDSR